MRLMAGILVVFVILFSVISPVYINYGKTRDGTIRQYGAHFNDSVNNIALIKSLKSSIPPENPNVSGTKMTSYHYFINLIMAKISQLFHIDDFTMYFKIAPIFLLSSLSFFVWILAKRLSSSNFVGAMATLFVMLSGNLYYLSGLVYPNSSGRPSVAWIDEFSSKLVNYQYLSSLLIMFVLFYILSIRKKLTLKIEVLVAVIVAFLFGFKFYAGVLFLSSMFFVKKFRRIFFLSIPFTLLVLIFLKGERGTIFPFEIKPLWAIKTMFESPDRINYPIWELARQTLLSTKSYLGIMKLYVIGILVYLFVNFGPRLIIFFKKSENEIESLIKIISVLGILIPLVFIQRVSAVWNIVQFSYYSVACMGFLLALRIDRLRDNVKVLIFSLVWIIMLPGVIYTSNDYAKPPYTSEFSSQFIQAAEYLESLPQGSILIHPQYSSNAIVSAIAGKPAYLAEEMILNSYGTNIVLRKKETSDFFEGRMINYDGSWFKSHDIKYVVAPVSWLSPYRYLRAIFSNDSLNIYIL